MGYLEDVAVVISKDGWKAMRAIFDPMASPRIFAQHELAMLEDFLKIADHHGADCNGDHLFYFTKIKMGASDSSLFFDQLLAIFIPPTEWSWVSVGEDGDAGNGRYINHDFNIFVVKTLSVDDANYIGTMDLGLIGTQKNVIPVAPVVVSSQVVDNYTCGCGNSKLNSAADKYCWKCGAEVR